jgi:hypothetical protein
MLCKEAKNLTTTQCSKCIPYREGSVANIGLPLKVKSFPNVACVFESTFAWQKKLKISKKNKDLPKVFRYLLSEKRVPYTVFVRFPNFKIFFIQGKELCFGNCWILGAVLGLQSPRPIGPEIQEEPQSCSFLYT